MYVTIVIHTGLKSGVAVKFNHNSPAQSVLTVLSAWPLSPTEFLALSLHITSEKAASPETTAELGMLLHPCELQLY